MTLVNSAEGAIFLVLFEFRLRRNRMRQMMSPNPTTPPTAPPTIAGVLLDLEAAGVSLDTGDVGVVELDEVGAVADVEVCVLIAVLSGRAAFCWARVALKRSSVTTSKYAHAGTEVAPEIDLG
jgi:hypothetical protein